MTTWCGPGPGRLGAQGLGIVGVVEHQQPRRGLAPQPLLEGLAGRHPLGHGHAGRRAGGQCVLLQQGVTLPADGFRTQPPDAGVGVAVGVAVGQRELGLADPAHAVQRGRLGATGAHHRGRPAPALQLSPQRPQQVVRILKTRTQQVLDHLPRPRLSGALAVAFARGGGHGGDEAAQANELVFPVVLLARLEGMRVAPAQGRQPVLERLGEPADRRHRGTTQQHRDDADGVPPLEAAQSVFDLLAHKVHLGQAGSAIDLVQPARPDQDQDDGRAVDPVRQALRKVLAAVDALGIEEQR